VGSEPSEDEHFVRGLTRALIRDHADDTETEFLGAQFDAGLAWVHWAIEDGGLGLSPGLQRYIDEELEIVGRRAGASVQPAAFRLWMSGAPQLPS
jgi:alkylation response protein AidB-like acyl-CoA dehydrogenase